uniref:Uncharacterized protein n=1 Tax=Anguilla anguilla TaxID=7936 RepID=A0A0E9UMW9_ANGAN
MRKISMSQTQTQPQRRYTYLYMRSRGWGVEEEVVLHWGIMGYIMLSHKNRRIPGQILM